MLGQQPAEGLDITIPITTQGRLSTVGQFEDIVVRANPDGSIIRIRDVARVSLEASSYNTESGINNGNAAVMAINMLPGANAMEVADLVKQEMEQILSLIHIFTAVRPSCSNTTATTATSSRSPYWTSGAKISKRAGPGLWKTTKAHSRAIFRKSIAICSGPRPTRSRAISPNRTNTSPG